MDKVYHRCILWFDFFSILSIYSVWVGHWYLKGNFEGAAELTILNERQGCASVGMHGARSQRCTEKAQRYTEKAQRCTEKKRLCESLWKNSEKLANLCEKNSEKLCEKNGETPAGTLAGAWKKANKKLCESLWKNSANLCEKNIMV